MEFYSRVSMSEVLGGVTEIGGVCKHGASPGVMGEAGVTIAQPRLHPQQRLHAFHGHVSLLPYVLPSD